MVSTGRKSTIRCFVEGHLVLKLGETFHPIIRKTRTERLNINVHIHSPSPLDCWNVVFMRITMTCTVSLSLFLYKLNQLPGVCIWRICCFVQLFLYYDTRDQNLVRTNPSHCFIICKYCSCFSFHGTFLFSPKATCAGTESSLWWTL